MCISGGLFHIACRYIRVSTILKFDRMIGMVDSVEKSPVSYSLLEALIRAQRSHAECCQGSKSILVGRACDLDDDVNYRTGNFPDHWIENGLVNLSPCCPLREHTDLIKNLFDECKRGPLQISI